MGCDTPANSRNGLAAYSLLPGNQWTSAVGRIWGKKTTRSYLLAMDFHPFLGANLRKHLIHLCFVSLLLSLFSRWTILDHRLGMESILPLQNAEVETTRTFNNACQTIHEQPTAHPSFFWLTGRNSILRCALSFAERNHSRPKVDLLRLNFSLFGVSVYVTWCMVSPIVNNTPCQVGPEAEGYKVSLLGGLLLGFPWFSRTKILVYAFLNLSLKLKAITVCMWSFFRRSLCRFAPSESPTVGAWLPWKLLRIIFTYFSLDKTTLKAQKMQQHPPWYWLITWTQWDLHKA